MIDSLQLTAKLQGGHAGQLDATATTSSSAGPVTDEEAKENFPDGWDADEALPAVRAPAQGLIPPAGAAGPLRERSAVPLPR